MRRATTHVDHIRDLDARLLLNGGRLAAYRELGNPDSLIVQRGVLDRLLDQRLALMDARDKTTANN